jgi:hypothetical protein
METIRKMKRMATPVPINRGRDPTITAFVQHGFIKKGDTGGQAFGICPFCGHLEHKHTATMYINRKTLAWDCKSCGKNGGFKTWLSEISELCQDSFKGEASIWLSKNRGLRISTLRDAKFGFNQITGYYCFPVMDSAGERIWDLRIYDKKRIKSTAGCNVGLYNWEEFKTNLSGIVNVCEGEWDGFSMKEMLLDLKSPDMYVASPGAGTFKAEWSYFFKDRDVRVLYDNDDPGREGSVRVYNTIKSETKRLFFLHWPQGEGYPDKWDLRDHYTKKGLTAQGVFDFILENLKEPPPGIESDNIVVGGKTLEREEQFTGEGLHYEEVYKVYKKWLELSSMDEIDVLYGSAFANRLPGDPIWMFLTGPSGATKSEFLMSLARCPRIVTTTTLTVPALISGSNVGGGTDPSLLAIMHNRVLIVKDFTTIIKMNPLYRDEIFGLFRDAYDGRIEKRFGNGVLRKYDPCKFGIIAGVTPIIKAFSEENASLGERYLRCDVHFPGDLLDQHQLIMKAIKNTTREDEMRLELSEVAKNALNVDITSVPVIPDEMLDQLIYLAQWTAILRSTVPRDNYSREITHSPYTELGTRLAKQFSKLLMGIGMFKRLDRITDDEYRIIKHVAISTVPERMEKILRKCYLLNPLAERGLPTLTRILNLPSITTQRMMENLVILEIFDKVEYIKADVKYRISERWISLIEQSKVYEGKKSITM